MAKRNTKTIFMLVSVAGMLTATAQAQTPVERGRYLVEGILTCGNCHSPRGPGGVIDTAKLYSGGPQTFDEPTFTVKGANITPDPDSGIGKWSADDRAGIQQWTCGDCCDTSASWTSGTLQARLRQVEQLPRTQTLLLEGIRASHEKPR